MRRPIRLIAFIFFVILLLCVVRVGIENSISTTGAELSDLKITLSSVRQENEILKEQYLKTASLTLLSEEAGKSGFVEVKSEIFLTDSTKIALKQ